MSMSEKEGAPGTMHSVSTSANVPRSSALLCMHCNPPVSFSSPETLNSHLGHSHPELSSLKCGHCKIRFGHKTSLMRHVRSALLEEQDPQKELQMGGGCKITVLPSVVPFPSVSDLDETVSHDGFQMDMDDTNEDDGFDMKTEAANFLMSLRSSCDITIAAVDRIQEHVTKLLNGDVNHLKHKSTIFLKTSVLPDVLEKFLSKVYDIKDPFEGLESIDSQLEYFSQKHGLVVPDEKFLWFRLENRLDHKSRLFLPKQVSVTFQSVSILETLKLFISNKYMIELIAAEQQSSDNVYRSYKDGSDFQKNRFLQKYPNAIRITLNYDDLEIVNGMGSKDVIHKLGCFYFSVQNIPPEESSKLSSIFLLALTYAEDLKRKDAFNKVFKPLTEDMKKLQSDEGVPVDLPGGGTYTLRACIVSLAADNLAAQALLGFLGPSANLFCTTCLVTKKDLSQSSTAIGARRTSRLTERHVQEVERKSSLSKRYGVKERSSLSAVMRVPEDSTFDAFHDLVGVIQMDISLVLYEFICVRKLFSVSDFNRNINSFVYGKPEIQNQPSANFIYERLCSKGYKLKQNGSQTFCLLSIFPFLITGVQEDDKYLRLIFLLQDIKRIAFSFEIPSNEVDNLDNLVLQHNNLFHEIFISPGPEPELPREAEEGEDSDDLDLESDAEEDTIVAATESDKRKKMWKSRKLKKGINKLHHLLHWAHQIREKGPIIRLWCARYEGRHRIFTKHAAVQCNFKNPPKTMANMFQLSTLGAFVNRTGPVPDKVPTSNIMQMTVQTSPYCRALLAKDFMEEDRIIVAKSVELKGEEYSAGLFVALKGGTGRMPDFGLICDIIVDASQSSRIYLAVNKCINEGISARYNCYKISNKFEGEPALIVTLHDLANYRPIPPWSPPNHCGPISLYLSPRTILMQ